MKNYVPMSILGAVNKKTESKENLEKVSSVLLIDIFLLYIISQ